MWYVVIDILGFNEGKLLSTSPGVAASIATTICCKQLKTCLYIDDDGGNGVQWRSTLVSSGYIELDPPVQLWVQDLTIKLPEVS